MLQLFKLFIGKHADDPKLPTLAQLWVRTGDEFKKRANLGTNIESSNMAATITKQRAEVEGSLYELQRLQEKVERYEM